LAVKETAHCKQRKADMDAKKILVIDDEENHCRLVKKSLESKGEFCVLTATRGKEGIMMARTEKPDLILLDIMMPDMCGNLVAEDLVEDPVTRSIPIIFLTAIVTQKELQISGGVIGGRYFISKPVIFDDLTAKINAVLLRNSMPVWKWP
jgi:DNA-binding response OmpR family regulator